MLLSRGHLGLGTVGSGINALAAAIQRMEGYYPGSLAYQNNNPGNLVYAGQAGAAKSCAGNGYCYAKFATYDNGYNALLAQINGQAARGQNLQQFIWQYAPPCPKAGQFPDASGICPDGTRGNNTQAYLASLQSATGANANTLLTAVIGEGGGVDTSGVDLTEADGSTTDANASGIDTNTLLIGGVVILGAWMLLGR